MKTQPASLEPVFGARWPVKDDLEKVSCLRCNAEITEYRLMRFTFLPYGISRGHAMLVCPKCGHVEFVSKNSPLLRDLQAIESNASDDD
jgi:hypothetical protein